MKIEWEGIKVVATEPRTMDRPTPPINVFRVKVVSGWLVFAESSRIEGAGMTFVPDKDHAWT
jgi:hypothetical protein